MSCAHRWFAAGLVLAVWLVCGRVLADPDYAMAPRTGLNQTHGFSEGLARVFASVWEEDLQGMGFVDTQGRYIVKPKYDKAGDFHDGRAAVGRYKPDEPGEEWGYIDRDGQVVIDLNYREAHAFSEGLAAVEMPSGAWQFIDRDGNHVLDVDPAWHGVDTDNPNVHHPLGDFHDGWLRIVDKGNTSNFVDRDGKRLRDKPYPAAEPFSDGLAVVSTSATPVEGPKGDNELSRIYDSLPGPAPRTHQWAVIDTKGSVQFEIPGDMGRVGPFVEGRAPFYRAGKWGIVDAKGKIVVPARYEHKPRGYGDRVTLFAVDGERSDNRDGYVETFDRDGKRIARIPFVDDQGRMMVDAKQQFHGGLLGVELARASDDGKNFESLGWGFIDAHGRVVVEPQFYSVGSFAEGYAFVSPKNSGTTGIMRNPLPGGQSDNE